MSFPARAAVVAVVLAAGLSTVAAEPLLWPLEIDDGLSASFGELRGDRIHTGIDLRTRRETGFAVRSVADGKVIRINEQWRGYGLVVYIRHDRDLVSVYAHLDRVAPELETLLARRRASRRSRWAGDVTVDAWPVRRGQVFAWSGESGAGLPHLHFELRRGLGTPIDPFAAGLVRPGDDQPPVAEAIIVRPAGGGVQIDGSAETRSYPLTATAGGYRLDSVPIVSGPIELLLDAYDHVNADNKAGLGGLVVELDGKPHYRVVFDRIPFDANQTAGVILDLAGSSLGPTRYLYRLSGLTGAAVPFTSGETGPLRLAPGRHRIEAALFDAVAPEQPRTKVTVDLEVVPAPTDTPAPAPSPSVQKPPDPATGRVESLTIEPRGEVVRIAATLTPNADRTLRYDEAELQMLPEGTDGRSRSAAIEIPITDGTHTVTAGARTIRFAAATARPEVATHLSLGTAALSVSRNDVYAAVAMVMSDFSEPTEPGLVPLQPAVAIAPQGHPLRSASTLSFAGVTSARAGVYRYDPLGGRWWWIDSGSSAAIRRLGTYAVLEDQARPEVRIKSPDVNRPHRPGPVQFEIEATDRGSGIPERGITVAIGGRKQTADYDPDRDRGRLTWTATAGVHPVVVRVEDAVGNFTELEFEVTVTP